MKQRDFLAVFQQDGSFELTEVEPSKDPIELPSNSLDVRLHDIHASVIIIFHNEMSREFLSSQQMQQVYDAIDDKLNNDDI